MTYSSQAGRQSIGLPECLNEQRHVLFTSVVSQNLMLGVTRQLVRSSILLTANSSDTAAAAAAAAASAVAIWCFVLSPIYCRPSDAEVARATGGEIFPGTESLLLLMLVMMRVTAMTALRDEFAVAQISLMSLISHAVQ